MVTASALLDLVSGAWLEGLADACRAAGASVLFALTYDGRIDCVPSLPDDARVRELVNRHQRTDKGFGPALGPMAAGHAETAFSRRGYQVHVSASDWVIGPDEPALQYALIDGWADAAAALAPAEAARLTAWKRARHAAVDEGRSTLTVGHQDLAGWLG